MDAQHADRVASKVWASDEAIVADLLRLSPTFNHHDAQTMCGVLEVNAFEVGDSERTCRAVYPRAFLLAHDCVPNTSRSDNSRLRLRIRAATDIAAGEPLTTTYAYVLQVASGTVHFQFLRWPSFPSIVCALLWAIYHYLPITNKVHVHYVHLIIYG